MLGIQGAKWIRTRPLGRIRGFSLALSHRGGKSTLGCQSRVGLSHSQLSGSTFRLRFFLHKIASGSWSVWICHRQRINGRGRAGKPIVGKTTVANTHCLHFRIDHQLERRKKQKIPQGLSPVYVQRSRFSQGSQGSPGTSQLPEAPRE